jgi:Tfp pilus assembly protein PilF
VEDWEAEQLTDEAIEAIGRGDPVRAVAITDQLAASRPEDPVIRAIRAQALLFADAGEDALEEARRAVELDPTSYRAHNLLGIAAWRAGRLTLAQQSLEQALRSSGRKPALLIDYAWFMASERGPRLAEAAAKEAVDADENASTAWAALGLAQFRLHRRDEAEASLQQALRLDPNDPYAQSAMITFLQEKRDDARALALSRLLEEVPGTEEFVESVRRTAKRREVAGKLVERGADPEAYFDRSHRDPRWLLFAAAMAGVIWLILQPQTPVMWVLTIVSATLVVWVLRRVMS